jgi:hypothetical protein
LFEVHGERRKKLKILFNALKTAAKGAVVILTKCVILTPPAVHVCSLELQLFLTLLLMADLGSIILLNVGLIDLTMVSTLCELMSPPVRGRGLGLRLPKLSNTEGWGRGERLQ